METTLQLALDRYWEKTASLYPLYPTVRHRKRWASSEIASFLKTKTGPISVFDYGSGDGQLLAHINARYSDRVQCLQGFDPAATARNLAAARLPHAVFYESPCHISRRYDVILCCEVVEHTPEFREILSWAFEHLEQGGRLLLSTQSGPIHASDRYAGHTQHFRKSALLRDLKTAGYSILSARRWGFPFFTLQKYLTNIRFDQIRNGALEGEGGPLVHSLFALAYGIFFFHDLLPLGPQIYVVAERSRAS